MQVFFIATRKALDNITAIFDLIWPISAGLWHLRNVVGEEKKKYPSITDEELAEKLTSGSGIHGVNYSRVFIEHTWEQQQTELAWVLLNSLFPIYEGWLLELRNTIFQNSTGNIKKIIDNPNKIKKENLKTIVENPSSVMKNSFYPVYIKNSYYKYILELLICYSTFKEARNCYMHRGRIVDERFMGKYNKYNEIKEKIKSIISISKLPEFYSPEEGKEIKIDLWSVVWFSDVLIKIITSLDTELLCSAEAEQEFVRRCKENGGVLKVHPNEDRAVRQIKRYIQNCGFPEPVDVACLKKFLIEKSLIS